MTATPVVTYSSTGVETTFPVPFPYLDPAHVKLYVNGTLVGPAHMASAALASIPVPYVAGARITLQRETPQDPLVVLSTGPLKSADLNRAILQSLYLVQEQQAEFSRTLRALPGFNMNALPSGYPGSIPEFDNAGNPQALPTDDLIEELLQRGVLGDGQIWPTTGGDYVAPSPGTSLTLDFPVTEAWLFPLFRNGVPQRPGVDYAIAVDGITVTITGGYDTGDRFWGYRAGGLGQAVILQRGVTSPEANWVRTDGLDWTAAFNRALATGKRVVGDPTVTYGITTPLALPNYTDLRDAAFKDLAPLATGHATRKLLYYNGTGRCRLIDVHVDRNGDGTGGALDTAAGIWLQGGRVEVEHVEVTGGNKGAGINVTLVTSGFLKDSYIHDLFAGTSGGSQFPNDVINAIALQGTPGFSLTDNRVENILTRWAAQPLGAQRQTRGIAIGGLGATTRAMSVHGNTVYRADQGFDVTGDELPTKFSLTGNTAEECALFGFKFAVSAADVVAIGNHAHRIGFVGFEVAASGATLLSSSATFQAVGEAANTHNIRIAHNQVTDQGYLLTLSGQAASYGIKIEDDAIYPARPRDIVIEHNDVDGYVDGSSVKWMNHGVTNQQTSIGINAGFATQSRNRVRNAATDDIVGFLTGRSDIGAVTPQTVANDGTRVLMNWNQSNGDGLQLATASYGVTGTVAGVTVLTSKIKTRLLVVARVEFAFCAGGDRIIEIGVNGTFNDLWRADEPATENSNVDCNVSASAILDVEVGDTFQVGASMRDATGAVTATARVTVIDLNNSGGAMTI